MAAPNFNDAYKYVVSVVVSIVSSKCQLIIPVITEERDFNDRNQLLQNERAAGNRYLLS